jgi:hypothetical protein
VHLAVYLPFLVPLVAALAAPRLARRLDPRLATWLLTGSAVTLAAATATALSSLVLAGLVQLPLIAQIGRLSLRILQQQDGPSVSVALLAAIALSAAVAAAGMLAALSSAERQALLAHERAHLRSGHHWFIAAAQLAAAANPLLRPLARAVAFTVERWADEDAARVCGDRRLVARTIARAALAKASAARSGAVPAWSAGFALGMTGSRSDLDDLAGGGPVPRRVAALLTCPPQRRLLLVIGVAVVLAATGVCTLEALRDLHDLLETASV